MITRKFGGRRLLIAASIGAAVVFSGALPASATTDNTSDVYLRDNTADTGAEPSSPPLYSSPDIRACLTSAFCASDDTLTAGHDAYIFVTLHNPGPYGQGVGHGTLKLYYTNSGTSAVWPAQWTQFAAVGLTVPIGTMTVPIHWASVPSYTHFCLLARWESAEDPMFPEGPSTSANTQNNNNIAWHNVNAVLAKLKIPVVRPILFGNDGPGPDPIISDLVFTQPKPIVGRLLVDLGPDLAARWRAAGQKGTGVRPVGDTQLEIVNPQQARISGIPFKFGERVPAQLTFVAYESGDYLVEVTQTNTRGAEIGGVEYRVSA